MARPVPEWAEPPGPGGPLMLRGCCFHVQPAQALVWLTVAIPLFITVAGLAIDGGVLLNARRQLQSATDGAARAAATRLDTPRLRASGGADIQLDPTLADHTA